MTSTQTIQGKSFKITIHLHEMRFPKNDKNGSHLMISGKPSHIQSQATKPFNPTCDLKRLLSLSAVVKDGSSNIHIFKQTLEIQSFLQDKMQKRNTLKKMQQKKTITLNTWTFHFGCQMVPLQAVNSPFFLGFIGTTLDQVPRRSWQMPWQPRSVPFHQIEPDQVSGPRLDKNDGKNTHQKKLYQNTWKQIGIHLNHTLTLLGCFRK